MIPLRDRLPPFRALLSPAERAHLDGLTLEQRRAFFRALGLSMLIRRPPE